MYLSMFRKGYMQYSSPWSRPLSIYLCLGKGACSIEVLHPGSYISMFRKGYMQYRSPWSRPLSIYLCLGKGTCTIEVLDPGYIHLYIHYPSIYWVVQKKFMMWSRGKVFFDGVLLSIYSPKTFFLHNLESSNFFRRFEYIERKTP